MVIQTPYLFWWPPVIGLFVPIIHSIFGNLRLLHGMKFYLTLKPLLFHWATEHRHKWFFLTILTILKKNYYLFIKSLISCSRFWEFGGDGAVVKNPLPYCKVISLQLIKKKKKKESTANAGDPGWISGLGRLPGAGKGNPLQYSCMENFTDRGASQVIVCEVAESQTAEHTHTNRSKLCPYRNLGIMKNICSQWKQFDECTMREFQVLKIYITEVKVA